jgi:ABC-type sugar transport system ATPase subunit
MNTDKIETLIRPEPIGPFPRLRMEGIAKHFGGVRALEGVTVESFAGEVHAICGENGAGKSTLMKILAGAITEFDGQILLDGKPVHFEGPRDAEDLGIRIIYQELNLVPELSVAANIFLGRERTNRFGLLDDREMERLAAALFERLGTPISVRARVADLRIGDQQLVEIAKALAFDAAVLIMDEPTSALSDAEVSRLFRVIGDLRASGTTVLYISHKMNEVFTLADRVTVLRDGQFVASAPRREIDPDRVVRWMVGREIATFDFEVSRAQAPPMLEVKGLSLPSPPGSGRPALWDIHFEVRPGEVVGIAGLLGAGRTELLECLFGAAPEPPGGLIRLDGREVHFDEPSEAIAAGVALVTEDRKTLGLFDQMTVAENVTLARLNALAHLGVINPSAERKAVRESIENLLIKTRSGASPVVSLSGGNQQKCVIARWLLTEPSLLLLDEPTRGIDVGAKAEIYALIHRLAATGMAILMTSSELPELLAVSNRILVLCEGRLTAEMSRQDASEERIMRAATQFLDRAAAS